jgi:hypothetical protein
MAEINDLTAYKEIRPLMKTGDRLEFASYSFVGNMIRLVTRKKVNHTAAILNIKYPGMEERRMVIEALEHGIEMMILSERLARFDGEVYFTPVTSGSFTALGKPEIKTRTEIGCWLLKGLGVPYDYDSLFRNLFGVVSQNARKFFCSEYYQMALASVGLLPGGKALRPGEFDNFDIFGSEIRII